MAHLIAAGGHRKKLTPSGELIGSSPNASIRVSAELGVADQHFQIGETMGGWQVFPMATTTVNGSPVTQLTALSSGDRVGAGSLVLEFENEAEKVPEAAHPLAVETEAVVAREDEPERTRRKWKLPAFPTRTLGLLILVGAIIAWRTDWLPMIGNSSAHFNVLADYAPAGTNFAASADVEEIGKFYERWRTKLSPKLPPLAEVDELMRDQSGLGFAECERASIVVKMDEQGELPPLEASSYSKGAVMLFAFESGKDVESSVEASWLGIKRQPKDDGALYVTQGGDVAIRVIDGRHLLVGTPENLEVPAKEESVLRRIKRLHGSRSTIAFTAEVIDGYAIPSDFGQSYPIPEEVTVGIVLAKGIKFRGRFDFARKKDAVRTGEQWEKALEWARTALEASEFEDLASHLKTRLNGSTQSLEIKVSADEIDGLSKLIRENGVDGLPGIDQQEMSAFFEQLGSGSLLAEALTPSSKPRADAEKLVSVYLSAVVAGSPELEGVEDAETAVRKIIRGVKGGEGAGFDELEFQVPLSEKDLVPALKHVRWDSDRGQLEFLP